MATTTEIKRAITVLRTATTKLAHGTGKAKFVEKAQQRLRRELCKIESTTPEIGQLRKRASAAIREADWQLMVAKLGGNTRRERRPKAKREFSCPNGQGKLSPFAGTPPTREQAALEMTRRRAFEAASSVTCQRGIVVPGKK